MLSALFLAHDLLGEELPKPPLTTALGGLLHHVSRPREEGESFSPTNVNFGLMPPLPGRVKKREKKALLAERGANDFASWLPLARAKLVDTSPGLSKIAS